MSCEHMDFAAKVGVGRITKGEGGPVTHFSVEVNVNCTACGLPLQFVGLPTGIDSHAPTVSVDALHARLVAVPQGGDLSLVDRIGAIFRSPDAARH